jgi:hypothetical protein
LTAGHRPGDLAKHRTGGVDVEQSRQPVDQRPPVAHPAQASGQFLLGAAEQSSTRPLADVGGEPARGARLDQVVTQRGRRHGVDAVQQVAATDGGVGDRAAADAADHLRRAELRTTGETGVEVVVGDPTGAVAGAAALDRIAGTAAEQLLALRHGPLERLVLQTVQGVVMHERRHRALAGQQVTPVLEFVGKVVARRLHVDRRQRRARCGRGHRILVIVTWRAPAWRQSSRRTSPVPSWGTAPAPP